MCPAKDMPSYSARSFVFLASSCCQTSPSGFHLALSFGIKRADYRERASSCVSRMNQITKRVDLGSFSRTAHKKQARKGNALQTSRAAGRGERGAGCPLHPDSPLSRVQGSHNTCTVYLCHGTVNVVTRKAREWCLLLK